MTAHTTKEDAGHTKARPNAVRQFVPGIKRNTSGPGPCRQLAMWLNVTCQVCVSGTGNKCRISSHLKSTPRI